MGQVYKYWERSDFELFLSKQAKDFGIDENLVFNICYSEEWNPSIDFNGCNMVQDKLHPFLPCFIHDYRWIAEGGGIESDKEFRNNLLKAGFSKWKAQKYFIAVRIAWFTYFKWTK